MPNAKVMTLEEEVNVLDPEPVVECELCGSTDGKGMVESYYQGDLYENPCPDCNPEYSDGRDEPENACEAGCCSHEDCPV